MPEVDETTNSDMPEDQVRSDEENTENTENADPPEDSQADAQGGKAQLVRPEDLRTVSAGGFSAICDAYAVNPQNEGIYFISMIGPQTSVKAIWSKLLNSPPSPAFISRGLPGLSAIEEFDRYMIPPHLIGTCTPKLSKLPNKNGWHAMVYTKNAEYSNNNDSFLLIARNEEEAPGLHYRFLDKRVTVPIHESWADWLWERGLENGEILPLECLKIVAYWCEPRVEELRNDLTWAIQSGEISLEEQGQPRDTDQKNQDPASSPGPEESGPGRPGAEAPGPERTADPDTNLYHPGTPDNHQDDHEDHERGQNGNRQLETAALAV